MAQFRYQANKADKYTGRLSVVCITYEMQLSASTLKDHAYLIVISKCNNQAQTFYISVVWTNKTVNASNSYQAFAQVVLNVISLEGHQKQDTIPVYNCLDMEVLCVSTQWEDLNSQYISIMCLPPYEAYPLDGNTWDSNWASLIGGMEYGAEHWNGKWNGTANVHSCS